MYKVERIKKIRQLAQKLRNDIKRNGKVQEFRVKLTLVSEPKMDSIKINDSVSAAAFAGSIISDFDREAFLIICLNTQNDIVGYHITNIGTLNECPIRARDVFKAAILANSNSVILAHNHPSGSLTPSRDDVAITSTLVAAGHLLGIDVRDHIIVTPEGPYYSFTEHGHIKDHDGS